jgi:cytochrome c peroxidase
MKTAAHLREIFGRIMTRMGFNDQEIVALAGAHALGRFHADAIGYVGPWTPTPTVFNNLYFSLLLNLKWEPNVVNNHAQYKDPSGKLMMLPSDIVLIEDPQFKKYVQVYATDQKQFFNNFAKDFQKLEELGTSGLTLV